MIEIPLSKQGKHKGKYIAIVDDIDADLASFRWTVLIKPNGMYVYRKNPNRKTDSNYHIHMHHLVIKRMGYSLESGIMVDHINGNGLDNRRENLRIATAKQNSRNTRKHKDNRTGYKGVTFFRRDGNYRASIYINNKVTHIGYFDTPEDAHAAYCEQAKKHFGEFANFDENAGD